MTDVFHIKPPVYEGRNPTILVYNECQNLRQYRIRFYLVTEQILHFTLGNSFIREVNIVSPNFRLIVCRCFTLIVIEIGGSFYRKTVTISVLHYVRIACVLFIIELRNC